MWHSSLTSMPGPASFFAWAWLCCCAPGVLVVPLAALLWLAPSHHACAHASCMSSSIHGKLVG